MKGARAHQAPFATSIGPFATLPPPCVLPALHAAPSLPSSSPSFPEGFATSTPRDRFSMSSFVGWFRWSAHTIARAEQAACDTNGASRWTRPSVPASTAPSAGLKT